MLGGGGTSREVGGLGMLSYLELFVFSVVLVTLLYQLSIIKIEINGPSLHVLEKR